MPHGSATGSVLAAVSTALWAALSAASPRSRMTASGGGGRRDGPASRTPTRRGRSESKSWGEAAPRERGAAVRARAASDRARPRGRALPVPAPAADDRAAAAALLLLATESPGPAALPLLQPCARSLLPAGTRSGRASRRRTGCSTRPARSWSPRCTTSSASSSAGSGATTGAHTPSSPISWRRIGSSPI
jgi:hypothetical protein